MRRFSCRFLLCCVLFFCVHARAATYTVTSTADPGDGICDVSGSGDGCTLRDAIIAADAEIGADTVTFDASVFATAQTITLSKNLPALTKGITISGPAARVTVDAGAHYAIFKVQVRVRANFSNLVIRAGGVWNDGGIITLTRCLVVGGSVRIMNSGTATANYCEFNSNYLGNYGTLTVANCLLNKSGISSIGTATITNCTLVGDPDGFDPGINNSGSATVTNCTVTGFGTSGITNYPGGALLLQNSLIVGNATNVEGSITDGGHNITSGTPAKAGLEVDSAGHAVLKDNGGATKTIALVNAAGSAVNAGDNTLIPGGTSTDGRGPGFPRIQGGVVDIGAFESALVAVKLSAGDAIAVKEGDAATPGSAIFPVTLSSPLTSAVTVNYATADGGTNGAKAGKDYIATNGTLTFAPGETSKTVKVEFIGDSVAELNEAFFLDIKTASEVRISPGRGAAYIKNDDGPSITIDDAAAVDEGNPQRPATPGTTLQIFTVHLSEASTNAVRVDWATANNTAGPADFIAASGTLTFAPGQTSKLIVVQIKRDIVVESTETYRVNLTHPTLATLADSQGIGYIRNDDMAAPLLFEDDAPSE